MVLSFRLLSSFRKFRSAVSEKKSKKSRSFRGHDADLCFPIGFWAFVLWFYAVFRASARGGGHWDLASSQVSLNSVQRLQRISRKYFSRPETRATILVSYRPGTYTLVVEDVGFLIASCQISWNSVQRFLRRSWKCHSQSETMAAILFFWSTEKTQTW